MCACVYRHKAITCGEGEFDAICTDGTFDINIYPSDKVLENFVNDP